ncbi:methyl-accepting chemotaxis protein [Paenibacillus sp. 1_12]|uniref:methyl-accepting chemotaxis protein n=1 Tax=Paenibacillus sp. 1_12 TaxID=1566278 RepID=UPI0008E3AF9E|nr:methyl-accepting chemotaxis protein [Paenibacillus sp. 1_12]SFL74998.1 methyl-accepting chemotaxis protein [Paenibacillus sp. 1_12]
MKKRIPLLQLTVGKKLYASFILVLILMCVLAWFTTSELRIINDKTKSITNNNMRGVEVINRINYLIEHVFALELQSMIQSDTSTLNSLNDEVSQTIKEIEQQFETYEKRIMTAEDLDLIVRVKTNWSDYKTLHTQFVQYSTKVNLISGAGKDGDQVIKLIQESQNIYASMKLDIDKLVNLDHEAALNASNEADELYSKSIVTSIILILIAAASAMALAYILSIYISRPVRLVSKAIELVAAGNLSIQVPNIKNRDEIGDLVHSLQAMIQNFGNIIHSIQDAVAQVADSSLQLNVGSQEAAQAANQVSSAMQESAVRAENQMRGSEETSKAMGDISIGIQRIAETTGRVSELAVQTTHQAEQGNDNIQRVIGQMNSINKSVEQSADELNRLNKRTVEIGEIITIIRDISNQTSLLSLNASIEAARAGEYGKGFAVVANEVKKLAEQSNQSATRIAELIQIIQSDSRQAVHAMNVGISEIQIGSRSIHEAGVNFGQIVLATERLSEQIQEVAAASEQIYAGGEEVAASITEIAYIAKKTFESTHHVASISVDQLKDMEEINSSTSDLSRIAAQMRQATAKFTF